MVEGAPDLLFSIVLLGVGVVFLWRSRRHTAERRDLIRAGLCLQCRRPLRPNETRRCQDCYEGDIW